MALPARLMHAGSSMTAQVIIDNATGHPLDLTGCGSLFAVALARRGYQPQIGWPAPPLPVGHYQATLFQITQVGPALKPIPVRVIQ